jgi:hypothetical protein
MIIATIYNSKNGYTFQQPFCSRERADKIVAATNRNMPEVGYFVILEYKPDAEKKKLRIN